MNLDVSDLDRHFERAIDGTVTHFARFVFCGVIIRALTGPLALVDGCGLMHARSPYGVPQADVMFSRTSGPQCSRNLKATFAPPEACLTGNDPTGIRMAYFFFNIGTRKQRDRILLQPTLKKKKNRKKVYLPDPRLRTAGDNALEPDAVLRGGGRFNEKSDSNPGLVGSSTSP